MDIKTRFLILSDTHAESWTPKTASFPQIDVAIHCGDLTKNSKIAEFRTSLELLRSIDAPLKLVIPGNHDLTLDIPLFKTKLENASPDVDLAMVKRKFGDVGEAQELFNDAEADGIIMLREGTHRFKLQNGATLTVYASPYTPSYGDWGFQCKHGHNFAIDKGVDVVITHGPPKGILDRTFSRERAGSESLLAAVARAQPRLHCFGHIHEGWGSKLVTWRDNPPGQTPSHFSLIDNERSITIETLSSLRPRKSDTEEIVAEKETKRQQYTSAGCCRTSHCAGDDVPLQHGLQTLFVNAAIQSIEDTSMQLPWIVDIELPREGDNL